MIASSTTIPKATKKANSEIIFIVNPKAYIPNAATKNDTGIPNAVIKATREFRKKYKDISNNDKPINPEDLTVSSLVLTFFEKSLKTLNLRPCGNEYSSTISLTFFDTSKTEASAVFVTDIFTAFFPLNLPTEFSSSNLCSTEATSFNNNCPPISLFFNVIFSIDLIDDDPKPLNSISPSKALTEPPGRSLILFVRALIISFVDIFFAEITAGLIITQISSSLFPAIPTPATPFSCIIFCLIFFAFANNKLCLVSP